MKTYEGFISNIKDTIKLFKRQGNAEQYIKDLKKEITDSMNKGKENIHNFFTENELGDINIKKNVSGTIININKYMNNNLNMLDIDPNVDVYKEVLDYLYSLSDDDIEQIKIQHNINKLNI